MSNDFEDFLVDEPQPEKDDQNPLWVNSKNRSLPAYNAILILKKKKTLYIRGHRKKTDFKNKGSYLITKAQVAELVGCNPQPLFNSTNYSESLSSFFIGVNEKLEKAKDLQLSKKPTGLRQKPKEELINQLRQVQSENSDFLINTVDIVFEKTLQKIPLDVKRKLGISG